MNAENLRDRTLDWMDRFFDSPVFAVACWVVIILALFYFAPAVVRILAR